MNVLHVVFNLSNYSGAAFQASTLISEINSDVFNNKILSIESAKNYESFNNSISVYKRDYFELIFILIKSIIHSDIVHIHGFSVFSLFITWILRKKVILKTTLNGSDDLFSIANSRFGSFKIYLASKVARNVVLSNNEFLINEKFIPNARIIKIPNSVIIPVLDGISKEPLTFCSVGIMSERKGFLDAIIYFIDNYSCFSDSKLYIVGPLPNIEEESEDCSYAYYQKCLEKSRGYNIIFTGKLNKSELNEIYKKSISFLFFSKREGMPNVLLEAMSFNCVPITGEIGGVAREVIDNRCSGFIIEPSDKISLDEIYDLSQSFAAKIKVQNNNDIKVIASRYRDIYESILI